jgi:hemoglobin-like flavoprotein
MNPEQIKLVQQSFTTVDPIAERVPNLSYDRLFECAISDRPMFPDDMTVQKQKLMQMLSTAVANLRRDEKILPALEELGRRHVSYGTKPDHYETVGEALLWTLEQSLGDAFTPAVKEAWTTNDTTIAELMKATAELAEPERRNGDTGTPGAG